MTGVALLLFSIEALAQSQTEALHPPIATKEDTFDPASAAREAFRRGTELARAAQWKDALIAFERSQDLRPHAVTTYNIAFCERAIGRYSRARKFFAKALSDHKARGGVELPENLVVAADEYLVELDRKLARLTISLSPADGAVAVDGVPLELLASQVGRPLMIAGTREAGLPEAVGTASFELLLEPGRHKLVISRAGYQDGVLDRAVGAGDRGELELRALPLSLPPSEPARETTAPNRLPVYAALGIGAAGLTVGVVAGIVAIGKNGKLDQLCPNKQCGPDADSTLDAAHTASDIATAGFIVGGVGAATGLALWWLAKPSAPGPQQSGIGIEVGVRSIVVTRRF